MKRPGRPSPAGLGFTLFEMLISLLIISVMAAMAAPSFLREPEPPDLDEAQGRLEALFRMARDSAVRTATPVTVVLDSASGLVWLDARTRMAAELPPAAEVNGQGGGPSGIASDGSIRLREPAFGGGSTLGRGIAGVGAGRAVPTNGQSLELPASVRMELYQARVSFTFAPNGSVVGDSLLLQGPNNESRRITVNPWNGRLRVR
jgi:prepilin-type N-terminal cleavage/methylation domain-containing protein